MNIYSITSIILLILFILQKKKISRQALIVSGLLIFLIFVCHDGQWRSHVIDYEDYMNLFLGKSSMYGSVENNDLEAPFFVYIKILRFLFPIVPFFYIVSWGVVVCCPLYYIIKKGSVAPSLSYALLLLVYGSYIFLFIFSAHRQTFATTFLLWAYYVYQYVNIKRKYWLVAVLLLIGLFSHSSSYFIIPIAITLFFVKFENKKILYAIVAASFIIGLYWQREIYEMFTGLMISLGDIEEISRSTSYTINDTYGNQYDRFDQSFNQLFPYTGLVLATIYFYSKEELKEYGPKCLIASAVLYNCLVSVDLMNRALLFFIIVGITVGLPKAIQNDKRCKIIYVLLVCMLLYIGFRHQFSSNTHFQMLPYRWFFL